MLVTNKQEEVKKYEIGIKEIHTNFRTQKIGTSLEAYNYIKEFYSDDIIIYESFFILLLNRANETIGYAKISQGGVVGTVVDVKIIAKYVVDSLASGVILAHNHPSGNLIPSEQDKVVTKKIKEALNYFDCPILDHIILTKESFYSFADNCNL